jgi:hypothetical protein
MIDGAAPVKVPFRNFFNHLADRLHSGAWKGPSTVAARHPLSGAQDGQKSEMDPSLARHGKAAYGSARSPCSAISFR